MKPFKFTVEVELQHVEGKFASRDDLAEQIRMAIEETEPGEVESDEGAVYEVASWEVSY